VKKCTPSVPGAWGVAEQGGFPAAEAVVGHGHGDGHVNADHADLDFVLEAPRRTAVIGEDGGAVAVGVGVDQRALSFDTFRVAVVPAGRYSALNEAWTPAGVRTMRHFASQPSVRPKADVFLPV
jgi:hypothetical protein